MSSINYQFKLVYFFFFLFIVHNSFSQEFQDEKFNTNNRNIQLLSDNQINAFWSNAKKMGYNFDTVSELLLESGYSYIESQRISDRIRNLEQTVSGNPISVLPDDNMTSYEKRIFGLKLFYQNEFKFSDLNNIPTPVNYQLGSGDQLSIVLFGETDANYTVTVDKSGRISFPFIGPFNVNGLSFDATKSLIRKKLSKSHVGLTGNNPTVNMDISISNIRTININILGEVRKPGSYSVPSTISLFNLLYLAGGPSINGTLRNLKVMRDNVVVFKTDIYKFISKGFIDGSFKFKDNDVLVIEPHGKRVEISGGIRNAGIFETVYGENIQNLIDYAGGYSTGADISNITLKRLNGPNQFIESLKSDENTDNLNDGDVLIVPILDDFEIDRIELTGAVNKPGFYSYNSNLTLGNLIENAGGMRKDADLRRISIFSLINEIEPKLESVNISKTGVSKKLIEKRSLVHIPSVTILNKPSVVSIKGSVKNSGYFPFYEGMTALDLIMLAKGTDDTVFEGMIEIIRVGENSSSPEYLNFSFSENYLSLRNIKIMKGDRVNVKNNYFSISRKKIIVFGEINYPGEYDIVPGLTTIYDIIKRSGPVLNSSNVDGIKLYRQVNKEMNDSDNNKIMDYNDISDEDEYVQNKSIQEFINDSYFSGSISKSHTNYLNEKFNIIKSNKIENKEKSFGKSEGFKTQTDSLDLINNYKESANKVTFDKKELDYVESTFKYDLKNQNLNNITLLNNDIIFFPPKTNLVELSGEVFNPRQVIYNSKKTFKEYVTSAGGYKSNADKKRSYVEYASGEVSKVKSFLFFKFYPKVYSDSRIIIPDKKIKESSSLSFSSLINIITTSVSTYLLVEAVTKN